MTQSQRAIHAAKLAKTCGIYASRRYAVKHGVLPLWRLAMQLEAMK